MMLNNREEAYQMFVYVCYQMAPHTNLTGLILDREMDMAAVALVLVGTGLEVNQIASIADGLTGSG
jgi:hypothetical protein